MKDADKPNPFCDHYLPPSERKIFQTFRQRNLPSCSTVLPKELFRSASQELPRILWNLNDYYRFIRKK